MSKKQKYLKELKKLKKNIVEQYKPEKIILFGSLAWGKFGPDSDIDLFIIKKTKKRIGERIDEVNLISNRAKIEVPKDFIIFTPKEIKERLKEKDFFIEDIIHKGIILYEKN